VESLNHLQAHAFFKDTPVSVLENLAANSHLIKVHEDQIVASYTEPKTDVFILMAGSLSVQIFADTGKCIFFRDVGPGELVGELAAIDNKPRSASILSLSDGLLATVPASAFVAALRAHPPLMEKLLVMLSDKIREMTDQIYELNAFDVPTRIISELCRLGEQTRQSDGKSSIKPAPTHEVLAKRVGTSREAVTRTLSSLAQDDLIIKKRNEIVINDIDYMRRMITDRQAI